MDSCITVSEFSLQVALDLKVRMDKEERWDCLDQVDLEEDQGQGEMTESLGHLEQLEPLDSLANLGHLGLLVLLGPLVLKERLDSEAILDLVERKDFQELQAALWTVAPETQVTLGHRDLQEMQVQLDLLDLGVMLGL